MLKPSYTELMDIVNQDAETDNKITSRYSIVIAAAKRARQIIDGAPFDAKGVHTDKAVSIAINEIQNGKIKIFPEGFEGSEETYLSYRHKPAGRAVGQSVGVALSADAVISSKDFNGDYGDDDMDDELFADEEGIENTGKEYNYDNGYERTNSFDDGDEYDDDYDYTEETIEEIDSEELDYS